MKNLIIGLVFLTVGFPLAHADAKLSESNIIENSFVGYYKIRPNLVTLVIPKIGVIDNCSEARFSGGLLEVSFDKKEFNLELIKSAKRAVYPFSKDSTSISTYVDYVSLTQGEGPYSKSTYSVSKTKVKSSKYQRLKYFYELSRSTSLELKGADVLVLKESSHMIYRSTCKYDRISEQEYGESLELLGL